MALVMHDPAMSALISKDGLEPSFGMGMHPHDFATGRIMARQHSMPHHLGTGYCRPWALAREGADERAKNLHFGKDGFQGCIDVHHFKPNEITVKTVDHTVVVEGKHEERDDDEHGSVTRHFIRKYVLPKEYDPHSINSTLSSDGVLTVKASPPKIALHGNVRHVPIQQTGPAHLSLKDNQPHEEKKENGDKKKGKEIGDKKK